MYFVHFPLVMLTSRAVAPLELPARIKLLASVALAVPALIGS